MSRIETQARNALRAAGVTDPTKLTLNELLRIPRLGPKGVAFLAEKYYPPEGPRYFSKGHYS